MKSKAKIYYWIDVIIGIAFVLSVLSGLVLLLGPSGGHQGGRNAAYGSTILLLGHHAWTALHTWSSIAMAAGVFGHLGLHWKWIMRMTKKYFASRKKNSGASVLYPNPTT
jgi:hypothetical protein